MFSVSNLCLNIDIFSFVCTASAANRLRFFAYTALFSLSLDRQRDMIFIKHNLIKRNCHKYSV